MPGRGECGYGGLAGALRRAEGDAPKRLTEAEEAAFAAAIFRGPDPESDDKRVGLAGAGWVFTFTAATYNLVRLPRLFAVSP